MTTTPLAEQSVADYLAALKESPRFGAQVVHHEFLPGSAAQFAALEHPLPEVLTQALFADGQRELYTHQVTGINRIRGGEDVLVATPTASGKSLIYTIPVLETMLGGPDKTALYLFPLKALARDQLRALTEINQRLPDSAKFSAAVCDGDTSSYMRRKLRDHPPNILLSNPDMLHLSLLGYHERWASVFKGLTHIVIDEVHTYRGVFGSHMAWVLRRLRRICGLYGSNPQFLLFSATVGNPEELGQRLTGKTIPVIKESGAPVAPKHFVFFDPQEGAAMAASNMLESAMKRGLRSICYTGSRKLAELVALYTKDRLGELQPRLMAYRAGFLPEERREIEAKMANGELLGVVSTSALELGIDIGNLDVCILLGYPGSVMSTWQRGGRVGRRQQESLIILIGQEDALDQYFMHNPADFFNRKVEPAVLNPENDQLSAKHLLCAAAEAGLVKGEPLLAIPAVQQQVEEMVLRGELLENLAGTRYVTSRKYPHRLVDLRGSGKPYVIWKQQGQERLGEIDSGRAFAECHPGALYLHRGKTWEVVQLDILEQRVVVRERKADFYTRPMAHKEIEILEITQEVSFSAIHGYVGRVRVTDQVTGFMRKSIRGQHTLSREPLDLPPQIFETVGVWFEVPSHIEQSMGEARGHFLGGIHAVEHAAIGVFPLIALCDRNDIGGIAYPFHPQVGGAAIFIYDGYPGGIGLCLEAFGRLDELLRSALTAIRSCPCETGCPSCVHSPKCGSGNRPIDKGAAETVLTLLLAGDPVKQEIMHARGQEAAGDAFTLPGKWAVFDLETKRSAQEVGGWHLAHKMGVSVGVVYDGMTGEYHVFREGEVAELIAFLDGFDLLVGFNNSRFDNTVLSAYTDQPLDEWPNLDLLQEVKKRLGYRLSLDRLAEQTLGIKKSADGLQALQWYKEGRIDKIITYCRHDVEITRDLFLFALENGYLLFQNKAGDVVRCPMLFS
jgi:DEAD/DEAH box helicase domain-containing protein